MLILRILVLTFTSVAAFLPPSYKNNGAFSKRIQRTDYTSICSSRCMMSDLTSSLIVATIDADIANIPTNEFAPIFAGGIMVMFGGLFSALIVGFIIDKRNLYVNIVADSYAQGADDEAFWKGLSEEEKKKTQELLQRLKESKDGGSRQTVENSESIAPNAITSSSKNIEVTGVKETREVGIFSDYGDE